MSNGFPSCDDFIASYGCVSYLDDDFVQYSIFENDNSKLILIVSDLHEYVAIELYIKNILYSYIYEDNVDFISLLDNEIKIFFHNHIGFFSDKSLSIKIYPTLNINSISMIS